jgi:hypothetical protein
VSGMQGTCPCSESQKAAWADNLNLKTLSLVLGPGLMIVKFKLSTQAGSHGGDPESDVLPGAAAVGPT